MRKTGLAGAIAARKTINEPEPQAAVQPVAEGKPKAPARRFHTTLYPDPELYRKIKIALLQEGEGRDFNQLVNQLLQDWYTENGEG